MTPHDIERVEGDTAHCRCGWQGTREGHALHFQVERARAALRGEGEDA